MPIRFEFRWIPFVAALLAIALGVALGQWQMRRAAVKQAIEFTLNARESAPPLVLGAAPVTIDETEYRRVQVSGEFVRGWPVYLDNRPHQGVAGFYILMPFKIADTNMHILVARGWIPRDPGSRTKLPPVAAPTGLLTLQGVARRSPGHVLQLGHAEQLRPAAIVQNVTVAEFAEASGLRMLPVLIEQTSAVADGLVRDWPRPSSGIDKHLGYAFQWYALAAMAFLFFLVTGFRRGTK